MKNLIIRLALLAALAVSLPVSVWGQASCALKQSTASQEISIGPFVDSTDGNTEETGLTIVNTDIRLKKGSADWAAKNSGGATAEEHGNYRITLDATDTATVGILEISVHASGALYVYKTCFVYPAAVYNALIGSGTFDSNLLTVNGTSQAAGDLYTTIRATRAVAKSTAFEWPMQFVTSAGAVVTSGTPACTRSIDAPGTFSSTTNSASAVTANGLSELTISTSDTNGNYYFILKCTLATAVDYYNVFKLQP